MHRWTAAQPDTHASFNSPTLLPPSPQWLSPKTTTTTLAVLADQHTHICTHKHTHTHATEHITLTAAAQHAAGAAAVPVKADQLLKVQPVGGTQLRHTAYGTARPHLCAVAVGVHDDHIHLATLRSVCVRVGCVGVGECGACKRE